MSDNNRSRNWKRGALAAVFIGAAVMLSGCGAPPEQEGSTPYSEFVKAVNEDRVTSVQIQGQTVSYNLKTSGPFTAYVPENENVMNVVRGKDIRVNAVPRPQPGLFSSILGMILPIALFLGVWIFLMRRMGGGSGGVGGFGKSKAKMLTEVQGRVTFDDVAGIDEAKEELQEVVEFLKDARKFSALGAKIPKGALLVGPPGTGKTLTARAVAGEAGVPFFSIAGSDFVEMYVGVGASRVRDMFEQAKKSAPCIIFIDEIDAVARKRGEGPGSNDEREQTLNQLLVEMDGFEANDGIIILAATNRPDVLDPAILRPGRFDRQVTVGLPDVSGREKILKVHARKSPLGPDVDLKIIARGTPGFSGADLANLVNEAALTAARRGKTMVTSDDFETAKDRVMMGSERKSLMMSYEERRLTAYHEAGHALLAVLEPHSDPIHKATIIPRGRALGMVMRLPEGDRVSLTRAKAKADLVVAAGGRVAEEEFFGYERVTTGASGDIQMMTGMAEKMVKEWGLSDKVGMVRHSGAESMSYLGGMTGGKAMSERTARLLDSEVKAFVDEGYARAQTLIRDNKDKMKMIAEALLEFETLTGAEIKDIVNHGKMPVRAEMPAPLPPEEQIPDAPEGEKGPDSSGPSFHVPKVPRKPPEGPQAPAP